MTFNSQKSTSNKKEDNMISEIKKMEYNPFETVSQQEYNNDELTIKKLKKISQICPYSPLTAITVEQFLDKLTS